MLVKCLVQRGGRAVAGCVSELRGAVSDMGFVQKKAGFAGFRLPPTLSFTHTLTQNPQSEYCCGDGSGAQAYSYNFFATSSAFQSRV